MSMDVFQLVTEANVRRVIMASPSKSSSLDPILTFLLKEVIDVLLLIITALINASLSQGRLPMSQKQAIVMPLLKKAGLDAADMANYRAACVQPDLSVEDSRVCCGQAAERILGGEWSTTAATVRLSMLSFYGDGAATCHVQCFRSRRPEACDITGATGPQRGV